MDIIKKHLFLILTFIIIVSSFLYSLNLAQDSCLLKGIWCGQDMDQYVDYSDSILSGHGYSAHKVNNMYMLDPKKDDRYVAEIQRLPAYSILLTFGRLFYNSSKIILIYNYVFYFLILIYSFLLLKIIQLRWIAWFFFICLAFNPTLIYYTALVGNADTFSAAALLGFVYHFNNISKSKLFKLHMVVALILGILAVMSRQNTLLFIIPYILISLVHYIQIKNERIKYIVIISGVILLTLLTWVTRNYFITGRPIISAASGSQLFTEYILFTPYPNSDSGIYADWYYNKHGAVIYVNSQLNKGETIEEGYALYDKYITGIVLDYMIHNKRIVLYHYLAALNAFYTDTTFTWTNNDFMMTLKQYEKLISSVFSYILILFPLTFILLRKEKNLYIIMALWFSTSLYIYISAFFHGVVIGNRGLLPVLPIVLIMFGFFIQVIVLLMKNVMVFSINKIRNGN